MLLVKESVLSVNENNNTWL